MIFCSCAASRASPERGAFHQLHHQVVWAHIEERADIRMIERGNGARLAGEALAEFAGGNLDADVAPQARVTRPVHFAPPALADRLGDLIRPESVTGGERHRVLSSLLNRL